MKIGPKAVRLGIGLHLTQDVADDRACVRLLAQIDQRHLDFRLPFDFIALECIRDELDFTVLLDEPREHLALFRVWISEGLGIQDRHDLAIEQNVPRLEHMLRAVGKGRVHDDVRVDGAGFEPQEVEANHICLLLQHSMLCRIQFDCVDVDVALSTIPRITRRCVDKVTFTRRGFQHAHEVAGLELLPGAHPQVRRGGVVL